MNFQNISFETEDAIAIVTLNRPQRRNALSLALMRELIDCLGSIGNRRDLRVVILAAAGSVTICQRWSVVKWRNTDCSLMYARS